MSHLWMKSRRTSLTIACVVAAAAVGTGCSDDPFAGATDTIGGEITRGDTLLFVGESATYAARAIYGVGPGSPTTMRWGASDTTVLEVDVLRDLTAQIRALAPGAAWIVALINEEFRDSVLVTVVDRGAERWDATFAGVPVAVYPAVGADSLIRVVTGGASPLLRILSPESGVFTSTASCFGALGPSLGAADETYASGGPCARRHARNGEPQWTAPVAEAVLGVAVVADGGAIVLTTDSVIRLGADGSPLWALLLGGVPVTAPVLGPGGDVYVGWSAGGADSVSRFALAGSLLWSVAVPGLSAGTPAATSLRLIFGRPGGIFALESTGVVAWDRSFADVNPAATPTSGTSSPVHDDLDLYVQNEEALYAYTLGGTFVWAADSLGFGATTGVVGAPTLLVDATLAVPCTSGSGGRDVCVVRETTGARVWRSPVGDGPVDGLTVGDDGIIYVTRTLVAGGSQVAALWARVAPATTGWPTEGGNSEHTRRR
ncbi:MAG TPA: PQQ-binding-like beta-propeller repeat protein [Gemmatimonadales bacterium]